MNHAAMEEEAMKKVGMMRMAAMAFVMLGALLQVVAFYAEFAEFAPLQQKYWSISKAEREAAPTGSELANQLAAIQNFPPRLMTFKLVGIGSILIGILIMLGGILFALGQMPMRLSAAIKAK